MIDIERIVFYGASSLAILSACIVISSKNPVRAVLFLALTFFSTAILWMLLRSEFLSIILILVYVGAIMVLFLFVIMMIDINLVQLREGFTRYFPFGILVAFMVMGGLILALGTQYFGLAVVAMPSEELTNLNNTEMLGNLLYGQYLFPLEMAGILLLAAMVTAISLTFRRRTGNKASDPGMQIAVRKEDRLRIIKMRSEAQ